MGYYPYLERYDDWKMINDENSEKRLDKLIKDMNKEIFSLRKRVKELEKELSEKLTEY